MVEGCIVITPDNFLNIVGILVNEVFGDIVFAILCGLVAITFICVKNSINLNTTIALNIAFALLTLTLYYNAFILALIIIVIGLIIVIRYQSIIRQQNN
jgi:hypothetical protein